MPVDPQTLIATLVRAHFVRGSHVAATPLSPAPTAAARSALKSPKGMLRLRRALRQALGLFD